MGGDQETGGGAGGTAAGAPTTPFLDAVLRAAGRSSREVKIARRRCTARCSPLQVNIAGTWDLGGRRPGPAGWSGRAPSSRAGRGRPRTLGRGRVFSGRLREGARSYAKDSDGYKVVNCPRAQPVFDRFGRLARGKVISVTVLRTVLDIKLPTASRRSPFSPVSRAWHTAR